MIKHHSQNQDLLSEDQIVAFSKELIQLFAQLQTHKVAHRNIKPRNICVVAPQGQSLEKCLRIANFEMAIKLDPNQQSDVTGLNIEQCSEVYSSPFIRNLMSNPHVYEDQGGEGCSKIEYNPFKEDVYSLGLSLLQMCLLCEDRELLQMRHHLRLKINHLPFSTSTKCLILLMLREDTKHRPDFLQLEGIYKDLLRQKDCERLFSDLLEEIVVP